jgi:hypothetical protein
MDCGARNNGDDIARECKNCGGKRFLSHMLKDGEVTKDDFGQLPQIITAPTQLKKVRRKR